MAKARFSPPESRHNPVGLLSRMFLHRRLCCGQFAWRFLGWHLERVSVDRAFSRWPDNALEAGIMKGPPNMRMKLSWRGGRLEGKGSILIAPAAPRSLCAIR